MYHALEGTVRDDISIQLVFSGFSAMLDLSMGGCQAVKINRISLRIQSIVNELSAKTQYSFQIIILNARTTYNGGGLRSLSLKKT